MVEDQALIQVEVLRMFFLNLNYLWGDWLCRDKLMNEKKRPDARRMSPKFTRTKPLHSVPVIQINMLAFAGKDLKPDQTA